MGARIQSVSTDGRAVEQAAACLRAGGLVVFPTETVYGLGADALNPKAVARVFEVKQRPRFDPLIVHIADIEWLRDIAAAFPPAARKLADRFWPGPLTFVLPKTDRVPDLVTAGLPSVAVRMPRHPLALDLIRQVGGPVAAPSANRFGHLSPSTAEDARTEVGEGADMILDGGPCPVGIESTIVSLLDPNPLLLRPGGLPLEDIESVIGPLARARHADERPQSPGRLLRHYAPRTPLSLVSAVPPRADRAGAGLLSPGPVPEAGGFAMVEMLSPALDAAEAAARLFSALRRLDAAGLSRIYALEGPERGLWRAINDRLRRASVRDAPDEIPG
ncbi:MAG TPA: L-threonylcarbamoyladenylate synthase [Kiritimatiellia bacterium]|nr:L-threonylcarbamoyladenylate synthase [Kiritimatiellia bacterium]HRZ10987.1 L-threonylcarbamoyladenylate synthase [Kiritimatiellia bacterium]HSA18560.1 L-threonylcarbamoyladenylate synthase [Kiritimatiellia bacterium]